MSLLKTAEVCIENVLATRALNAFISRNDHDLIKRTASQADGRSSSGSQLSSIDGRLIAIKDNVCTLELPTTCASRALAEFKSPYDATLVRKLKDAGAIIAGKTNLDEFGMGSHSTNSSFGAVSHANSKVSPGGSSGGSAVAVATRQCWASIGTDTGGSVRLPAAYTGTIGFKPSYGIISRHGVVPYANSLDTVGIIGNEVNDVKDVFDVVRGYDSKDPTSLTDAIRSRLADATEQRLHKSSLRIGIPMEYNTVELQPIVRSAWQQAISRMAQNGHQIIPVSLPATKLALSAYYILAPAEASSNLAKYDGVRYGQSASVAKKDGNVLFATVRGERLGEEVRKRILLGSFTLSATAIGNYFIQAQRIRRLIQQDFDTVFAFANVLRQNSSTVSDGIDLLLAPTAPSLPPRVEDLSQRTSVDSYRDDVLTVPASLAGLPAISLPVLPVNQIQKDMDSNSGSIGLQLIGQYGDDDFVLEAAEQLRSCI